MPLAEYNDVTRMTRLQLADRIRQMETTAARNSSVGSPNDRHRPMEDRRRREKIALYREELDRRERMDAYQRAADQRTADDQAAADARAKRQSERDTRRNAAAGYTSPLHCSCGAVAIADLETRPACAKHGAQAAADRHAAELAAQVAADTFECACTKLAGDVADASECPLHNSDARAVALSAAIAAIAASQEADTMNVRDYEYRGDEIVQFANRQDAIERDQDGRAARDLRTAQAAADARAAELPAFVPRTHAPVIPPPPSPALSVECPQCHAVIGEKCHSAHGYPRTPHAARKLPEGRAVEPPPADTAQVAEATDRRRAKVAAIRERTQAADAAAVPIAKTATPDARDPNPGKLSTPDADLRADMNALLAKYTLCTVIDAAWDAVRPGARQ